MIVVSTPQNDLGTSEKPSSVPLTRAEKQAAEAKKAGCNKAARRLARAFKRRWSSKIERVLMKARRSG